MYTEWVLLPRSGARSAVGPGQAYGEAPPGDGTERSAACLEGQEGEDVFRGGLAYHVFETMVDGLTHPVYETNITAVTVAVTLSLSQSDLFARSANGWGVS